MNIILGGTGHIGSVVAKQLRDHNLPVTIVSRNAARADVLKRDGAQVASIDVNDTVALQKLFSGGERLFLLNPPADPSSDTVLEERKTLGSIISALKNSSIRYVVAASTYGARPGEGQGDLNVLYDMEQSLSTLSLNKSIIRSAYYMSNWDAYLESARAEGILPSFYPLNFALPMVSPADIGKFAASLLMSPQTTNTLHHIEGPQRYTPADVAAAFSKALGKPVKVIEIPEEQWDQSFQKAGFSPAAAQSYAAMTKATLNENFAKISTPVRGETTLDQYIEQLVRG